MCFFSAVNIDGNLSKKSERVGWKWDPRIPRAQQIMNECYGNPPKFSRGHMTRREDPAWGDAATAKRGNEDSMHVTNTTPQMQAFNSPIWLALEDYALDHAREDDMKISVFTGPYFDESDPVMYGVRIPLAFWKIIAFIHDETGELCATGYEMHQEQSLPAGGVRVRGIHLAAARHRGTGADPIDRGAQPASASAGCRTSIRWPATRKPSGPAGRCRSPPWNRFDSSGEGGAVANPATTRGPD